MLHTHTVKLEVLYFSTPKTLKVEEKKENCKDLESVIDLLDLDPMFEVQDQGDGGVVIAVDNWVEWPLAI
jgi:hypothetical protein